MPSLSVRNLDSDTYSRLRKRAADHGRSMEAEARAVLEQASNEAAPDAIRDRAAFFEGIRQRRLARSGGRVWKDSTRYVREDRDSR